MIGRRITGLFVILLIPAFVAAQSVHRVYVPPTPASIPLIIAADHLPDIEVTVFASHSQAHTLFLRKDIPLLVTGLSVGIRFFENGVPVQIINSYISGMTALVTRGEVLERFGQLKGKTLYLPFAGSPIEEITRFFALAEGLTWKKDFKVIYAPFESSLELLKKGQVRAVVLPQPFIALVAADEDVFISIDYENRWNRITGGTDGYPQIGTFVDREWAAGHPRVIADLNREIGRALETLQRDPERVIDRVRTELRYSKAVLSAALAGTHFALKTAETLEDHVRHYHRSLGKPLNEAYQPFFYLGPQ